MKKIEEQSIFDNVCDITLSIVTYNSADEIDMLLTSIYQCNCFDNITVFVIDNHSYDNTIEIIEEKYPWVRVIKNDKNLGFGKAHNLVIRNVKSKYHLIVNPDIVVFKDTIEKAIQYMEQKQEIAIMTPSVFNTDGTQQYLPKKNPRLKYLIGGMFENRSKYCRKLRDAYTLRNENIDKQIEIEFCTGAFMICRTNLLQKVNGFDERYFLHFEDADLTRELKKVGKAIYNPDIKVVHKWQRENKKMNKSFWIALQSMFIYMRKWR